jgi:putative oxidoreductase
MSEDVKISVSTSDLGQLLIRLAVGGLFVFVHGWMKVTTVWNQTLHPETLHPGQKPMLEQLGGAMGQLGIHFWPSFWGFLAMSAEFGGGLLLLLGLLFRPACAMLGFTMVMATITVLHLKGISDPSASAPILAGAAVLGMLLMGPGKFSLKHAIKPLRSRWYG